MTSSRSLEVLRECLGTLHRELKISLCRPKHPEIWVFIVGCYNSGTTLLTELLDAHQNISALPEEGQYLTDQFPSDHELGLSRMWVKREDIYRLTEADDGPDIARLKKEWGIRLNSKKRIFVEKTPANSARTRWLQHHFENARFIAIVRNGYAVAEGIRRKGQPVHPAEGWPISDCAKQWRRSYEVLLEDEPHLKHLLWVRYEDLTEDPEAELERIASFLDLDGLSGIDLESEWSIHERHQQISNLNEESIHRLSDRDIETINGIAGGMLDNFGYKRIIP